MKPLPPLAPAGRGRPSPAAPAAGGPPPRPPEEWALRRPFSPRALVGFALALALLGISARHTEMPKMIALTAGYVAHVLGLNEHSEVARGVDRFVSNAWPPVVADERPVARISGFNPAKLPAFSYLAERDTSTSTYDYAQQKMITRTEPQQVLVRPLGYLWYVLGLMVESLEIAMWGTLIAIGLGVPMAYLGTRGYSPSPVVHALSRSLSGFLRAIPELVSALLLLLAFGPGPIAGALALGLHSAGFFGKFYADDVENADPGPQEALTSLGARRLEVWWFGALPQVLPQYVAYTQYILERNVRMATVIGIVGAGGVGVELKGRFDTFEFGQVTTILLVIFATVLLLERVSQWVRSKLI